MVYLANFETLSKHVFIVKNTKFYSLKAKGYKSPNWHDYATIGLDDVYTIVAGTHLPTVLDIFDSEVQYLLQYYLRSDYGVVS